MGGYAVCGEFRIASAIDGQIVVGTLPSVASLSVRDSP